MKSQHYAPSVEYPAGRSFALGLGIVFLQLCSALALGLWFVLAPSISTRHGMGLGLLLLVCMVAGLFWWRSPTGQLCWDGRQWLWRQAQQPQPIDPPMVRLDLQHFMLVQVRLGRLCSIWLCLEKKVRPRSWLDIRRALYSPAGARTQRVQAVAVDPTPVPGSKT